MQRRIEDLKKRTKCAICKLKGHWKRECPKRGDNVVSANMVEAVEDSTRTNSAAAAAVAPATPYPAAYPALYCGFPRSVEVVEAAALQEAPIGLAVLVSTAPLLRASRYFAAVVASQRCRH